MIDRTHVLPVSRQARLPGISHSSVYYLPRAVSDADLALMRGIDELHLEHPFAGAHMLVRMPRREDFIVGRKHVSTLRKCMGVEALYRKPNTQSPRWKKPLRNTGSLKSSTPIRVSQFTSEAFTDAALGKGILLLMDGQGSCYLARANDPPPGNKVIWRGKQRLVEIQIGYRLGRENSGQSQGPADCLQPRHPFYLCGPSCGNSRGFNFGAHCGMLSGRLTVL